MTTERDPDSEPTVELPRPLTPVDDALEDVDPEKTLVREDWESTVVRRVAPHVVALHYDALGESEDEDGIARYGWESEGLRRLSQEVLGK
jgi:hypothetical protein